MNQPEQVAFEKTYNLWQTSAPSANVKHAFREGHDMGWKNAIKHISRSGEAVSNYSQAELGETIVRFRALIAAAQDEVSQDFVSAADKMQQSHCSVIVSVNELLCVLDALEKIK